MRSLSRENSLGRKELKGEITATEFMKAEDGQEIQEVVREATTTETSLRHFFYLEYKTNFPDGQ
jgi:hypothetical protein